MTEDERAAHLLLRELVLQGDMLDRATAGAEILSQLRAGRTHADAFLIAAGVLKQLFDEFPLPDERQRLLRLALDKFLDQSEYILIGDA